jgi:hypothetical protein
VTDDDPNYKHLVAIINARQIAADGQQVIMNDWVKPGHVVLRLSGVTRDWRSGPPPQRITKLHRIVAELRTDKRLDNVSASLRPRAFRLLHAIEQTAFQMPAFRPKPMTAGDRHPTGGPTPSGRQTLVVGSHHCPGSQARGCGPTPSGKQALLNGSQYCPGSHAELTAGVPIVVTAIAAAASMTTAANRPTRFRIADLLDSM